ncbi:MAG: tRNA pseudouridine(55) synthase TruB, partial [Pseudomonadota bacterium]
MDESCAVTLPALEALAEADAEASLFDTLLPLDLVLDDVPKLAIEARDAAAIKQGREITLMPHLVEQWRAEADRDAMDRLALTFCEGKAVALGEVRAGRFQPKKVFQL